MPPTLTSGRIAQGNGQAYTADDFQARGDYVLLEPIERDRTPGGIALPEKREDRDLSLGRVVEAGPGAYLPSGDFIETKLAAGDVVWLAVEGGYARVHIGGKKYFLCHESQIAGVVPKRA